MDKNSFTNQLTVLERVDDYRATLKSMQSKALSDWYSSMYLIQTYPVKKKGLGGLKWGRVLCEGTLVILMLLVMTYKVRFFLERFKLEKSYMYKRVHKLLHKWKCIFIYYLYIEKS